MSLVIVMSKTESVKAVTRVLFGILSMGLSIFVLFIALNALSLVGAAAGIAVGFISFVLLYTGFDSLVNDE